MEGRPWPGVVGEQPELREAEVPEDLAFDPEFALVHRNDLRADAVGSREIGSVDVLFAASDLVQGAGDFLVARLGPHGDERLPSRFANRSEAGDQILSAGLFRAPGHPEGVTEQIASLDSNQRRFVFVNLMTVRTKIADASSAEGDVREGVDAFAPGEAPKGTFSGVSKSRTPIASSARRCGLICFTEQIGIASGPPRDPSEGIP